MNFCEETGNCGFDDTDFIGKLQLERAFCWGVCSWERNSKQPREGACNGAVSNCTLGPPAQAEVSEAKRENWIGRDF